MNKSEYVIGMVLAFFGFLLGNSINGLTGNAITNIQLPTLPVVILTALVDSINPCAIGVLILLIGTLLFLSKDKGKMLFTGSIYIIAVYVTYFLAGIGLLFFLQNIGASIIDLPLLGSIAVANLIGIIVAVIVIIGGLIEVKDAAKRGGRVAGNARKDTEKELGQPVTSRGNYLSEPEKKKLQNKSKKQRI